VIGRWPPAWQFATGRRLGRAFMRLRPSKRSVVRRNLEVCFPELSAAEREDLVVRSFESVGISLFEMAAGWYLTDDEVAKRVAIHGRGISSGLWRLDTACCSRAHFAPIDLCFSVLQTIGVDFAHVSHATQRDDGYAGPARPQPVHRADSERRRPNAAANCARTARSHMPDQAYLGKQPRSCRSSASLR
jgi:lauroyl/myristoyl acyltransferase